MPEPKPGAETKTEEKGNLPEEVTKVLEDIKTRLENQGPERKETPEIPKAPTYSERRADLQKKMGFNDEQMAAHEQSILSAQAPIIEQSGWDRLGKKSDIDTFRKEIEAELAIYPQERRTPDIMEKIYYFVKGKHADSKPAPKQEPGREPGVTTTRISGGPGYSGADAGLPGGRGSGEGSGAETEQLNELEKFVSDKLGVSEKDYAKAKSVGRTIRDLKPQDTRQATSLADMELRRMIGR